MAIQNIAGMKRVLDSYDAKSWTKPAELDFEKKNFELKDAPSLDQKTEAPQSFGDFLANSVSEVNNLQVKANTEVEKLATGESKNIHETLLAVEQAEIAFKTMNQIRQKVIDAYREIMKMQV